MQRICVIGVTGSGKTTLARALSKRLQLPYVELDALHWDPNWTEADDNIFFQRTAHAVRGDRWVIDGNYSRLHALTIDRADTVVWLDLPFFRTFWRLLVRTIRRAWNREVLWNGNRERFWAQLCTRDSIFLWCISSYGRRQRTYPDLLARCSARGQTAVRLRSQREIDAWLRSLPALADTVASAAAHPRA